VRLGGVCAPETCLETRRSLLGTEDGCMIKAGKGRIKLQPFFPDHIVQRILLLPAA